MAAIVHLPSRHLISLASVLALIPLYYWFKIAYRRWIYSPPHGRRILVNGSWYYINWIRPLDKSTRITVICEADIGGCSASFFLLQQVLNDMGVESFSYDRLGYGNTEIYLQYFLIV